MEYVCVYFLCMGLLRLVVFFQGRKSNQSHLTQLIYRSILGTHHIGFLVENLVVLAQSHQEDDWGHVFKTVNPLPPLWPLTPHIHHPAQNNMGSGNNVAAGTVLTLLILFFPFTFSTFPKYPCHVPLSLLLSLLPRVKGHNWGQISQATHLKKTVLRSNRYSMMPVVGTRTLRMSCWVGMYVGAEILSRSLM